MAKTTYRGVSIPTAGDGLLSGFEEAFASAGIITQADSVAAARLMLTEAASGGGVITPARPMYFDIGGVVYIADGTTSSGVWVLRPVNEVETDEQTYTQAWSGTVTPEQFVPLMTSGLVARPYDRVALVTATLYGYTGSGAAHIAVTGNGSRTQEALGSGLLSGSIRGVGLYSTASGDYGYWSPTANLTITYTK